MAVRSRRAHLMTALDPRTAGTLAVYLDSRKPYAVNLLTAGQANLETGVVSDHYSTNGDQTPTVGDETASPISGTRSAKFTVVNTTGENSIWPRQPYVAVTPGEQISLSASVRGPAGRLARAALFFYSSAPAYVSSAYSTDVTLDGTTQRVRLNGAVIPAGVAYVGVSMRIRTGGSALTAGDVLVFDNVQVERGPVATAYTDPGTQWADNLPVTTVADLSGNGRDATQATAAKRPTFRSASKNLLPYRVATADDLTQFTGTDALVLSQTAQVLHGPSALSIQPKNLLENPNFDANATGWSTLDLALGGVAQATQPTMRTNLLSDPSFATTSGTTAVRTNMHQNPRAASGTSQWVSNAGTSGASTVTQQTGQTWSNTGITTSARRTWTGDGTAIGGGLYSAQHLGATAGRSYTVSGYVRISKLQRMRAVIEYYDSAGAFISASSGTHVEVPANTVVRLSHTSVAPANTDRVLMALYAIDGTNASLWLTGDWLEATGALVEESDVLLPFFDGASTRIALRRNEVQNPSFEVDLTAWAGGLGKTRVSGGSAGSWAARLTRTNASGYESFYADITSPGPTTTVAFDWTPGVIIAYSRIEALDAAGATISRVDKNNALWVSGDESGGGGAGRYSLPVTGGKTRIVRQLSNIPAAAAKLRLQIMTDAPGTAGDLVGTTDAWVVEAGATSGTYFDGSMGTVTTAGQNNLVANPEFETTTANWNPIRASIVRDTSQSYLGSSSGRLTTVDASNTSTQLRRITQSLTNLEVGKTYTLSAYMKTEKTGTVNGAASCQFFNASQVEVSSVYGSDVVLSTSAWTRVSVSFTVPANTVTSSVWIGQGTGSAAVGDVFWIDAVLVEEGSSASAYVGGSRTSAYAWTGTANASTSEEYVPEYTYAWTGTANASTSQQKAPALVHYAMNGTAPGPAVFQTTERSLVGATAGKVVWDKVGANGSALASPNAYAVFVAGNTYTMSAWLYVPSGSPDVRLGVYQIGNGPVVTTKDAWVRASYTFTATATTHTLYFPIIAAAGARGDDTCYVDGALVEAGDKVTNYFDGATTATPTAAYAWTGTANASTSTEKLTAQSGTGVLSMADGGAYTRQAVTPSTQYTASAYVFPPAAGVVGLYAVSSPTPTTETGTGRRYAMAKNGPGPLVEEATVNLLVNPGLEHATSLTDWASNFTGTVLSADRSRSFIGTTSLRVDVNAANTGVWRGGIAVKPNVAYTFSAWIYIAEGSPVSSVTVLLGQTNTAGTTTYTSSLRSVTLGVWTRVTQTATMGADIVSATVHLLTGQGGTAYTFWADAMQFEEKGYATSYADGSLGAGHSWDTTTNLVTNPSFEEGITNTWTARGSGVTVVAETGAGNFRTGAQSAKVTMPASVSQIDWGVTNGATQIAVTPGQIYTVSAFVKGDATGSAYVAVITRDSAGTFVNNFTGVPAVGTDAFRRVSYSYTIPSGVAYIQILVGSQTANYVYYVDDVQVELRSYASPYGQSGVAHATSSTRVANSITFPVVQSAAQPTTLLGWLKCSAPSGPNGIGTNRYYTRAFNLSDESNANFLALTDFPTGNYALEANGTTNLPATVAGDVIFFALTIDASGNVARHYSINGAALVSATATGAAHGARTRLDLKATDVVDENIAVINSVLSTSEIAAIASGTTLPSAVANRSDCIFSAFINDGTYVAGTVSPKTWTRLTHTKTFDKNTTQVDVVPLVQSRYGVTSPTYLDAAQLEQSATATTFVAAPNHVRMDTPVVLNISPNTQYTVSASSRAATTLRGTWFNISYFDSGGGFIPGFTSPTVNNAVGSWVQNSHTFTTPANAARIAIQFVVASVNSRELHYVDQLGLVLGSDTTWTAPVTTPNGHPVFQFDGVDDWLDTASGLPSAQPITMYVISATQVVGPSGSYQTVIDATATTQVTIFTRNPSVGGSSDVASSRYEAFAGSTIASSLVDLRPHRVVSAVFNGASSSVNIDGVLSVSGSTGTNAFAAGAGLRVGARISSDNAWPGTVAAVLVFSGAHTASQRKRVERWLGRAFGMSVANS